MGDGSEGKRGWQQCLSAPHPLSFCTPSWHRGPSTKEISELLGSKTHKWMFPNFVVCSLCKDEEWAASS